MAKSDRIARVAAPRRLRAGPAMLTVALALATASCSDDDSAMPPSTTGTDRSSTTTSSTTTSSTSTEPTSTTSATSTTGGQSVEDEIIARYVGYWDARLAANSGTPAPNDPALREFATDRQLETVIAETRANLDQGLAFRARPNPADVRTVTVVEVDGDRSVVQECFVDDGLVVRRDTGEVVNDTIATHNVRGELVRIDGAWRVSEARLVQRWEGVAGCALDS